MTRLPTGFSYGLPVLFVLIMTAGLASMLGATPSAGHALVGASPTPTCGPAWNVVPSREGGHRQQRPVRGGRGVVQRRVGRGVLHQHGLPLPDAGRALGRHTVGRRAQRERRHPAGRGGGSGQRRVGRGLQGPRPGPYETLAMHWDGTQWAIVPTPNPGAGGQLLAVSAVAANDVWAVGIYQIRSPRREP